MKAELRGPPKIVHAAGHSFSDVAAKCVHIVNLASVRELERTLGRPVDPLRFRANLYLDGVEPWAEFGWLGKEVGVGDGQAGSVQAHASDARQPTSIPARGVRDMAIPAHLQRTWGHQDFGIYAKVVDRRRDQGWRARHARSLEKFRAPRVPSRLGLWHLR